MRAPAPPAPRGVCYPPPASTRPAPPAPACRSRACAPPPPARALRAARRAPPSSCLLYTSPSPRDGLLS
eukprot:4531733-Pleurochrysis_carterae.AAC.1